MTGVIGDQQLRPRGPVSGGTNWAMSATGGTVAWRRRLIRLSSMCGLIATAALRRSRAVDLDDEEHRALVVMRHQLAEAAESLRTGTRATTQTPDYTFAFSQLAYIREPAVSDADDPDPQEFAEILETLAGQLQLIERWDPPSPDAAKLVFDVFEDLARWLLAQIARPGESYRSPRRAAV